MKKRRQFSVFSDCATTDDWSFRMRVERVFREGDDPDKDAPIEVYLLCGDDRIAKRINCRWESIVPGLLVQDTSPHPSSDPTAPLTLRFEAIKERLQ
jgi:hypothetical protein